MNEISRIVDQLEREHAGDPWHGSPLSSILAGVTHTQAAAKPIAVGAQHLGARAAHRGVEERSAPPAVGGAGWRTARRRLAGGRRDDRGRAGTKRARRLELAHRLLVSAVKRFPEAEAVRRRPTTPRHDDTAIAASYYELLHGIVAARRLPRRPDRDPEERVCQ